MNLNPDSIKPIYLQIAEWLEAEILAESIKGDERIYSQYQLADMFNINPATAAKGLNILADSGIVYKKRGLGMYVSPQAKESILSKHKNQLLKQLVKELVMEAKRLHVGEAELMEMINDARKSSEEEDQ